MARVKSLASLQPEFRAPLERVMARLAGSKHSWQIYETHRPTSSKCGIAGPTSKADPCVNPTKHAYGAAADIVPHGTWGPPSAPWRKASWPGWTELRNAAHAEGLDNDIKWDRPHVEVSRATMIKWLQSDLGVDVDGKWGPLTDAAARKAAQDHGVQWHTPEAKVGPRMHWRTYRQLREELADGRIAGGSIVGGAVVAVVLVALVLVRKG